jgi:hypothetical protein
MPFSAKEDDPTIVFGADIFCDSNISIVSVCLLPVSNSSLIQSVFCFSCSTSVTPSTGQSYFGAFMQVVSTFDWPVSSRYNALVAEQPCKDVTIKNLHNENKVRESMVR